MTDLSHDLPLTPDVVARVRFTAARDGDFAVARPDPELDARRRRVVNLPWTWLHQVHGADVVVVDAPGAHAGARADAAVTAVMGAPLAIHTADCVPIIVTSDAGAVGAVHAGWRGLVAGIVEQSVAALRDLGDGNLRAIMGPCIHPECYEFGAAALDEVAARFGDSVRAHTADGRAALDVSAAAREALRRAGVDVVAGPGPCTSCGDPAMHSYRARSDAGRQAAVVWLEAR